MSKKHFKALAHELSRKRPVEAQGNSESMGMWRECVAAVTDVCSEFNTRFDREKFVEACNFNSHVPQL